MMLTRLDNQRDESLIYHLNLINDWFVFGSVGFRQKTDFKRMKLLFYKLIRPVEQNNKGQFVVRFEGDNIQRERHFHFLLGKRGLVTNNIKEIQKRLKERTIDLALSDYPEYETCSPKFKLFNSKLDGIRYVSKIAKDEKENLCGLGLDSCVEGLDWKMSQTLKKRLIDINTTVISHY
jgi:hypothetical protein